MADRTTSAAATRAGISDGAWFAALSLASVIGLVLGAATGWPGAPSPCADTRCWCEVVRDGSVREIWNTVSNLPIFALAIFVAVRASWFRRRGRRRAAAIARTFAYALWLQATGALLYHASLVEWAAIVDGASVLAIWGALLSTSLFRVGGGSPRTLADAVAGFGIAAGAYRACIHPDIETPAFGLMLATLSLEPVATWRRPKPRRLGWLAGALVCFGASVVVWSLARPGAALCELAFPFHALWHVLAGLAITAFGLHAATD